MISQMIQSEVAEEGTELTLSELCRASQLPAERILELVAEGVIDPSRSDRRTLRFRGICVHRVLRAQRLQRDLGVNVAGAALVLDLIEENRQLRVRLRRFEINQS